MAPLTTAPEPPPPTVPTNTLLNLSTVFIDEVALPSPAPRAPETVPDIAAIPNSFAFNFSPFDNF